jgi:hypothetical protein
MKILTRISDVIQRLEYYLRNLDQLDLTFHLDYDYISEPKMVYIEELGKEVLVNHDLCMTGPIEEHGRGKWSSGAFYMPLTKSPQSNGFIYSARKFYDLNEPVGKQHRQIWLKRYLFNGQMTDRLGPVEHGNLREPSIGDAIEIIVAEPLEALLHEILHSYVCLDKHGNESKYLRAPSRAPALPNLIGT